MSPSIQVSTNDPIYPREFTPFSNTSNVAETSMVRPFELPMISNPLFKPTAPNNSVPQPIMYQKSNNN